MALTFRQPWTRQPISRGVVDRGNPLSRGVLLAAHAAEPGLTQNLATRSVTPAGIALASATDNACQFGPIPALQNADLVTVQTLLYAASAPSGTFRTRIFGTRGTTEGDSNRRGWEVSLDGGTFVEANVQVFDSGGSRFPDLITTSYSGSDVTGKLLFATFQISRNVGAGTGTATAWLKTLDLPESTASTSIAAFGDDTAAVNRPEICGKEAGNTTNSDFAVLQVIARTGTISDNERFAWYRNPWQIFAPLSRFVGFAAPAASGIPVLSAATAISITATTADPQVTLTF